MKQIIGSICAGFFGCLLLLFGAYSVLRPARDKRFDKFNLEQYYLLRKAKIVSKWKVFVNYIRGLYSREKTMPTVKVYEQGAV